MIIKRIIKGKIDEINKKWDLIRGIYYISFFLMLFAIFFYFLINTESGAFILLFFLIIVSVTFIIYLKNYEKKFL